jgi:ParB family transcriptional regulator, chromosome partitioning protein
MKLELHQLDRRYEHLRVRNPQRQKRLLASLAESEQQTPIVVIAVSGETNRYLVIDGYKRIAALGQLGRDTVDAVVWAMNEAEALLLERSMRFSEPETALEQGWLLSEFHQRFGCSLDEIARRFDRSLSWVSRRLALVEILPGTVQQEVRAGEISPQVAMKCLVPMARSSLEDCQQMADVLARHRLTSRQANQLYTAWRNSRGPVRRRILEHPLLFLKAEQSVAPEVSAPETADLARDLEMVLAIANRAGRKLSRAAPLMSASELDQAQQKIQRAITQLGHLAERIQTEIGHVNDCPTDSDSGTACSESSLPRDCAHDEDLPQKRARGGSIQLGGSTAAEPIGKSRTVPPTDPGSAIAQQRQSCPGP